MFPRHLHLAEGRIRAQPCRRIDEIDIRGDQQVRAFASNIGECADKVVRKRPLHRESPLGDVHVFAVAVIGIRRNRARAVEKRCNGIGKSGG